MPGLDLAAGKPLGQGEPVERDLEVDPSCRFPIGILHPRPVGKALGIFGALDGGDVIFGDGFVAVFAGVVDGVGLEVEDAEASVLVFFDPVDPTGDGVSDEGEGMVFSGKVGFGFENAPSGGAFGGFDLGPPGEAATGGFALDEDGGGELRSVALPEKGVDLPLERGADDVRVARTGGVGIAGEALKHVVEEIAEVAGVHLGLFRVDFLHPEAVLEIEAEGAGEVAAELGHAQFLKDPGVVGEGLWFQLPRQGPRERLACGSLAAEELEGAFGQFGVGALEKEPRRSERIAAFALASEEQVDPPTAFPARFDEGGEEVGVAGEAGVVVGDVENAAGGVGEKGVADDGLGNDVVVHPGDDEVGRVFPEHLEPALEIDVVGLALVVEVTLADQFEKEVKSLGRLERFAESLAGRFEGSLGFEDGGGDFGEGAVGGFLRGEGPVGENFGEVGDEDGAEFFPAETLRPVGDPLESLLEFGVLGKIPFRGGESVFELVGETAFAEFVDSGKEGGG